MENKDVDELVGESPAYRMILYNIPNVRYLLIILLTISVFGNIYFT